MGRGPRGVLKEDLRLPRSPFLDTSSMDVVDETVFGRAEQLPIVGMLRAVDLKVW